jgi:hypothetical protein
VYLVSNSSFFGFSGTASLSSCVPKQYRYGFASFLFPEAVQALLRAVSSSRSSTGTALVRYSNFGPELNVNSNSGSSSSSSSDNSMYGRRLWGGVDPARTAAAAAAVQ